MGSVKQPFELRAIEIELNVQRNPEGSVLYRSGQTAVLIGVSVEDGVRDFLRGTGKGWVTAEYDMHPRANPRRKERDRNRKQMDGRSTEIQRLIGRALRSVVATEKLGERTITVDCDVLDADGGTRTAAISGAFVALSIALDQLRKNGLVGVTPLRSPIGAISVGLVKHEPVLDLCYEEDRVAQMDMNVVATPLGELVEVQGTAEAEPIAQQDFQRLMGLAVGAMPALWKTQKEALERAHVDIEKLIAKVP